MRRTVAGRWVLVLGFMGMGAEVSSSESSSRVEFGQISVPRLLFGLLRQRFTGSLQLEQAMPEPGLRSIWFHGGMPIFTDWVDNRDVLGEILVAKHILPIQNFEAALTTLARNGGLLGQILMKQGSIDAATLGGSADRSITTKAYRMHLVYAVSATTCGVLRPPANGLEPKCHLRIGVTIQERIESLRP